MPRRRHLLPVIAVATATLAAGCGNPHTPTGGAAPPSPSTSLQAPPQSPGDNDQDADLQPADPAATWDAASRTSAIHTAETAMRAFARPTISADAWWRTLQPLLSRNGATAYLDTDPREIPAHRVTGAGRLDPTTSAYLAQVRVPTDAGTYTVLLVRTGATTPWLVERLTPPSTAPR